MSEKITLSAPGVLTVSAAPETVLRTETLLKPLIATLPLAVTAPNIVGRSRCPTSCTQMPSRNPHAIPSASSRAISRPPSADRFAHRCEALVDGADDPIASECFVCNVRNCQAIEFDRTAANAAIRVHRVPWSPFPFSEMRIRVPLVDRRALGRVAVGPRNRTAKAGSPTGASGSSHTYQTAPNGRVPTYWLLESSSRLPK
jgi:hypothetical protein